MSATLIEISIEYFASSNTEIPQKYILTLMDYLQHVKNMGEVKEGIICNYYLNLPFVAQG